MDLLKTLLVYMTMVYASSVQSMPDAEAYMATVVHAHPGGDGHGGAYAPPHRRAYGGRCPSTRITTPSRRAIRATRCCACSRRWPSTAIMRVIWTAVSASRPGGQWNAFNTATA